MHEDEFIGKLKQLSGVWSLDSKERLLMSDRALKEVGSNCKDLKSLEFGKLFANVQLISQETLLKTLRNLRKLKRLEFSINSEETIVDSTLETIRVYNRDLEALDMSLSNQLSDYRINKFFRLYHCS